MSRKRKYYAMGYEEGRKLDRQKIGNEPSPMTRRCREAYEAGYRQGDAERTAILDTTE